MRYYIATPSNSLNRLGSRLGDIDQIKAAHDAAAGGPRAGRRWNTESLNRAAIVLLAAHLEGFLEDIFRESVATLERASIPSNKVPDLFQIGLISPEVRTLARSRDHAERVKALQKLLSKVAPLVNAQTQIQPGNLDPSPIVKDMGNPTPDQIESFFAYLGIDHVLDGISWQSAGNASVRRNLRDLVELRNRIAHGEPSVQVLWVSVRKYRAYVLGVAQAIDSKLRHHLTALTGSPPWPS